MQRAQQMDLLALWGKNSCSLILKPSVRRTSRAQLAVLSLTPRKYRVKQGSFMYRFDPKFKNDLKLICKLDVGRMESVLMAMAWF